MEGWIKIHRKLANNKMWTSEPFTRSQAWVDLIMLANYKDSYFIVRGNRVDVKRGQCGWSVLSLSDRWKWSRGKVERYLNEQQNEQQIVQQKSRVTTLITILNYDEYQGDEQQTGQQNGQQTDIYKKYSIENKEGFTVLYKKIITLFPENYRPKNKTQQNNWIDALDKLNRLDNLSLNTILEIINWGRADEFWSQQFRSIVKLRRTDKDGIPFHVIFKEKMDKQEKIIKPRKLGSTEFRP